MSYAYKIKIVSGSMDTSTNPPEIIGLLFPSKDYLSCELSTSDCLVTFATPQTPADLGPLVKVELISNDPQ
jgi:hypothetical protein